MRLLLLIVVALSLSISLTGCSLFQPLSAVGSFAVNTPEVYTENRVFFVDADDSSPLVSLVPWYKSHSGDGAEADNDADIKDGDPLSVIVSGVRLPEDINSRIDTAVILDIATSSSTPVQSMVVFYQRDVPGGQMLNFQNLLVYYDPVWDATSPPYFRIRLLDVRTERNERTRELLDRASSLGAAVGNLMPHPILPAVTSAIEAARLVLSNPQNKVLLDYQVQFYSALQRGAAGGAPLQRMRSGEWLVVGRPYRTVDMDEYSRKIQRRVEDPASIWTHDLCLDRRSGRVYLRDSHGGNQGATEELNPSDKTQFQSPYVSVIVSKSDAQVPKLVMDRSAELLRLLSSPSAKSDTTGLENAIRNLSSSISFYSSVRAIKRYRLNTDLGALIDRLKNDSGTFKASPAETQETIRFIRKLVGDEVLRQHSLSDTESVVNWWMESGANGSIVEDSTSPLGVKWVGSQQNR